MIRMVDRAVSLESVIDVVNTYFRCVLNLNPSYLIDGITSLPTVAAVVHAHWIRHDYADIVDGYYVPEYECSECKGWVKDDTDFCPNCGAKMDGGDGNVTD